MSLLRHLLEAFGAALVGGGGRSTSTELPDNVRKLIAEINEADFGGINYNEHFASTCWVKLPGDRIISARWYPNGNLSELYMRKGKGDIVHLPHDQYGHLILDTLIAKVRRHQQDQLNQLF